MEPRRKNTHDSCSVSHDSFYFKINIPAPESLVYPQMPGQCYVRHTSTARVLTPDSGLLSCCKERHTAREAQLGQHDFITYSVLCHPLKSDIWAGLWLWKARHLFLFPELKLDLRFCRGLVLCSRHTRASSVAKCKPVPPIDWRNFGDKNTDPVSYVVDAETQCWFFMQMACTILWPLFARENEIWGLMLLNTVFPLLKDFKHIGVKCMNKVSKRFWTKTEKIHHVYNKRTHNNDVLIIKKIFSIDL